MNTEKLLADAKELGLKRGYVMGYYLSALHTIKRETGEAVDTVGGMAETLDVRGVGGILHAICEGIIRLDLPYETYLTLFGGLFQNELFTDDEFSKQYSAEYHRLCEFYKQEIPIDNGSHLAGQEHSPFRNPSNKPIEQQ